MTESRDIPEAVQWSEGMLLGPHHFQQAARRSEALLYHHLNRAIPYFWGVSELQIDPVRLAAGTVSVISLEAVMPDGVLVVYPTGDGSNLQIDLAPYAARLQEAPLKVYLVLPGHRGGASLVTGQFARYRSVESAPVVDENTGDNEIVLPRLRPSASLYTGDTPGQNFIRMPLAEVAFRNEGFELTSFMAPQLAVTLQSPLAARCRGLLHRIREKALFVAERLHAPEAELRQATIIELRHSLHCLAAGLPAFEAALGGGVTHPHEIYLTLSHVVGNLALLGTAVVPPLFEPYDHNDLQNSFDPVFRFAERMLEGISQTHISVPFTYEAGVFRLLIEPSWLRQDLMIGVRAGTRQSEAEVNAWLSEAVIASSERVGASVQTRVRGAARRPMTSGEDFEFLPARGTFTYRIVADPNFIVPRRILEIFNPSDRGGERRPLEIVLYVPTEAGQPPDADTRRPSEAGGGEPDPRR